MNIFIIDPKNKVPSVSLTLLIVSFICLLVGDFLEMFEKVKTTSNLMELMVLTVSLYFGRRLNFKTSKLEMNSNQTDQGTGQ